MKGLLLKDAYQTWCYIRWIILVSVAMMLMGTFFMKEGSNFFMLYGGLLLGMSPMTLLAYDQSSRFSAYCAALPVTKEQIVGGKYLVGLCGMALAELLSMAALAAALGYGNGAAHRGDPASGCHVDFAGQHYFAAADLPLWLRKGKICVLSLHWYAGSLDGHYGVLRWDTAEQHPARQRFAAGAGGRAGAVCSLVAAVGGLVRKGRAVR